jgi:hypothetical protein
MLGDETLTLLLALPLAPLRQPGAKEAVAWVICETGGARRKLIQQRVGSLILRRVSVDLGVS